MATTLCFIGVGSNVGPRVATACRAWQQVQARVGAVVATSHLYDTAPQHVVDQPRFLNGVVVAATALPPRAVLRELKAAEAALGREDRGRHGPREVDLDVLFHGTNMVADADLEVPHPRAARRDFVLRPLRDARRALDVYEVPYDAGDVALVDNVLSEPWLRDATLARVWAPLDPDHHWPRGDRTPVMGILNATPDSFSDGGEHASVAAAVARAGAMVDDGADCLDVGGESTRPGAVQPPLEEELARVLPVVEALRAKFPGLPLSVDTRRGAVAAAARAAGATLTNDVSGGSHDPAMLATLADDPDQRGVCLMHMRGTPLTMADPARRVYAGGVVDGVAAELRDRVAAAAAAGVAPWRVLVDPGVGFAKDTAQNLELLRGLGELRRKTGDLPLLLGVSRKRFLGDLTGEPDAAKRDAATAGACAATVPHADVVRVHDVRAARHALAAADAILR